MIGIDLFSGAGGLSLGASQAGINIKLSVEADNYASETYAFNHPGTLVFSKDIRLLDKIDISSSGKQKILFGGPPCQGFSTSNQKNRNSENPSNWLYKEFIRIAKLWKPDWVLLENVKGIIETEKGAFLYIILDEFEKCGYSTSYWVLNAADFGVPQNRNRLFIIGSAHGIKIEKPKPTVSEPVTVSEAIFDLPSLQNGASSNELPYKSKPVSIYSKTMRNNQKVSRNHLVSNNAAYVVERYKHIPQGGNWESIPINLMTNYRDRNRCHTGIYRRLKESEPSVVIGNYRKNMLIHPIEDRGLSVREAARLQSFPDWYEFKGSIGFQQQQVGNAVPPLLAQAVFENIIKNSC